MVMQLIQGQIRDLGGGLTVRRMLPSPDLQGVGPFVFFDHFGPIDVTPASQFDVRPHPHIGLATVTYLFEGALLHRDSIGTEQRIAPGAVNWMTAGRGVVHSERRPPELREITYRNHGLQLRAALPEEHEEAEPAFHQAAAAAIPEWRTPGVLVRVLIGTEFGLTSPVPTFQGTLFLDIRVERNRSWELEPQPFQCAIYGIDRGLQIEGSPVSPQTLVLLDAEMRCRVTAPGGARFVVIGGSVLGRRHLWWNFVSSRPERIEQAKADWRADRMGTVLGETERIPAPT